MTDTNTHDVAAPPTPNADTSCIPPRGLWGWSPPMLAADSRAKRWTDRLLPRTGAAAVLFFLAVLGLLNLSPLLAGPRLGTALFGIGSLAAGLWCSLNFWRCRHAHCLITGPGFTLVALLSFTGAALGRSLVAGNEGWIFDAVLALGILFELAWRQARGSNAVTRHARAG